MTTAEWQLSPLEEVGKDHSKMEQKIKKNSNPSIWSNKRLLEGFIGVLCQSLLLHVVLETFHPNHNSFGRFLVKCQNFAPDLGEKYNQTKLEAGLAVYYYVFFIPFTQRRHHLIVHLGKVAPFYCQFAEEAPLY